MSKVFINESTLTAIGNAIREKTGKSDLIAPGAMADEITSITTGGGGGDIEVDPIVLTGDQNNGCSGQFANIYINLFGDTVSTKDLTNANYMFKNSTLETIPFDINFNTSSYYHSISAMFSGAENLKQLPKINNARPYTTGSFIYNCYNLREIPEDIDENWDWSYIEGLTSGYSGNGANMFSYCYSLRSIPMSFLNHGNPVASYSYSIYYGGFSYCYALDEIKELPIPYTATWTSNTFSYAFSSCHRLKDMTFALDNGQPYIMKWKSQTIDLSGYVGYGNGTQAIVDYNSGITADKQVKDDATYQALKDDPDWFTTNIAYSRYNHDSAVNTINSLPDTSAYLATAGGTNTIKFKGAAGSATDGGAINTLTEEEIAVAAAKGWTVSLV